MEAPEKIYIPTAGDEMHYHMACSNNEFKESIEYIRADTFMEKALKWYCLDCECNDNCKDTKCFFYREFERYLKGDSNALPPKFTGSILNEDGSTSDNWRHRHFIIKMQKSFIEKAVEWILSNMDDYIHVEYDTTTGRPTNEAHIAHKKVIEDFKKAMKL